MVTVPEGASTAMRADWLGSLGEGFEVEVAIIWSFWESLRLKAVSVVRVLLAGQCTCLVIDSHGH